MKFLYKQLLPVLFFLICVQVNAQSNLSKPVSLNIKSQRLEYVLQQISKQGGFYFSYDSRIIAKDSLVNISASSTPVKDVLEKLFAGKIDYKENGNYIILRRRALPTPPPTPVVTTYIIKGKVIDAYSGLGVGDASVYEKNVLANALTNADGSFVLKIKTKLKQPVIFISRHDYFDTSIAINLPASTDILINLQSIAAPVVDTGSVTVISPTDSIPLVLPDSTFAFSKTEAPLNDSLHVVEKTRFGKFLLSTKQKVQSINLSKFYTTRAYQLSFTPGLSTHGRLSSQVENYVSINAIGGYTGGTKAFEAGGVFNINRKDAQYFQAAGTLNIVGGNMKGFQAAGLHNNVLGNVYGFQAAGISNYVNSNAVGFQTAGIYNHVKDSATGVQVAGISNYTGKNFKGVQVGGIFNYAKKLNGVQIGLINVSDSSNGYSIGLINFVKHGMHQLSFSANEITNTNVDLKTGNKKLYSILHAGYNFSDSNKVFSYGYGIGTTLPINKSLSFQPELISKYLYTGDWNNSNILNSLRLNLQLKLAKGISIFAAPSFNLCASNQTSGVKGYRFPLTSSGFASHTYNDKLSSWIGFSAGVSLF